MSLSLAAVAGFLLSLLFEYVPGFATWYEPKTPQAKRLIMLALVVVSSLIIFGLSCYSPWVAVACSGAGVWDLLLLVWAAITANQALYALTKKPE